MTKKSIIYVILGALFLLGLFYLLPWFQYSRALDNQADEFYKTEYIGKSFSGRVSYIHHQNEDPHKVVISFDDSTEFDITYGVTCVDDNFNAFVKIGDSAFKNANSKLIRFCKTANNCKDIELYSCGEFE